MLISLEIFLVFDIAFVVVGLEPNFRMREAIENPPPPQFLTLVPSLLWGSRAETNEIDANCKNCGAEKA
jgi:hypothetical protein